MENDYECICGEFFSATELPPHVEKEHIFVAISRFVEDIKKIINLEELKKYAVDLEEKAEETPLNKRRKSRKLDIKERVKLEESTIELEKLVEKTLEKKKDKVENKVVNKRKISEEKSDKKKEKLKENVSVEGETLSKKIDKDESLSERPGKEDHKVAVKTPDKKIGKIENSLVFNRVKRDRTPSKKLEENLDRKGVKVENPFFTREKLVRNCVTNIVKEENHSETENTDEYEFNEDIELGEQVEKRGKKKDEEIKRAENEIPERKQITSPIMEEELNVLGAFDSLKEVKEKYPEIKRFRCEECEFMDMSFSSVKDHILAEHTESKYLPREQIMRIWLDTLTPEQLNPDHKVKKNNKRGRPRRICREDSTLKSQDIHTEIEPRILRHREDADNIESLMDQPILNQETDQKEKHLDDLLKDDEEETLEEDSAEKSEDEENLLAVPNIEETEEERKPSPIFGNIEMRPATESSDEEDSFEHIESDNNLFNAEDISGIKDSHEEKKTSIEEERRSPLKKSKEKWKIAKKNLISEEHEYNSDTSSTSKDALSSRTVRELKNLNITFNESSKGKSAPQIPQQEVYKSRKRKVKKKEDALYSLLQYLLDKIMLKDVCQSFLEPIDESFAPGYSEVIKEPMDLTTMENKLCRQKYQSLAEFIYDFNLIHSNCLIYNPEECGYYSDGVKLKKFGENFFSEANLKEIPSYSKLSEADIGVHFQSQAEINAMNRSKRSSVKDQSSRSNEQIGSENESQDSNEPNNDFSQLPPGTVLTISERVKLRQQTMGSNTNTTPPKKKSPNCRNDSSEDNSSIPLESSSEPSTSSKEINIKAGRKKTSLKGNIVREGSKESESGVTILTKSSITLTPCDNTEDSPSPSPEGKQRKSDDNLFDDFTIRRKSDESKKVQVTYTTDKTKQIQDKTVEMLSLNVTPSTVTTLPVTPVPVTPLTPSLVTSASLIPVPVIPVTPSPVTSALFPSVPVIPVTPSSVTSAPLTPAPIKASSIPSPWKKRYSVSSESSEAGPSSSNKTKGTKRKRRPVFTRRKNRKRKLNDENYQLMEDDEDENEEEDWFYEDGTSIQCCLCGKWRFLGEISEREMAFIEYWDCSMNSDKSHNKCTDPEDEWDTGQTGGHQTSSSNPTPDNTSDNNATITNNPPTNTESNYGESETNFTSENVPELFMNKQYDKPKLTQRALILLAKQNLDPDSIKILDENDIGAFISLVFPYYNEHYEECVKLVKKKWKPEVMKDVRLSSSELNQLSSLISTEQKGSTSTCVKPEFLQQLVNACDYRKGRPEKHSGNSVHLSWGAKELFFLGLIAMDIPLDILQVRHFLELSVPGIESKLEGWSEQIQTEMINMPEIDIIQHGKRKLYYIRENYKNLVKELLQGGGGSSLPSNINKNNPDTDNATSSINESNESSILANSLPSGLHVIKESRIERSLPSAELNNRFCVPLEVMAYMKAFLGDFSPIKLSKLSMILNGIYKHLNRDYIEEYLAGECLIFILQHGDLVVRESLKTSATCVLQYWIVKHLQTFKEDLKETNLHKIVPFTPLLAGEQHCLQQLIADNISFNKEKISTWCPTINENTIMSLAVRLTAKRDGHAEISYVKNFINLHFPWYALTRTEINFLTNEEHIPVNELETKKAVMVIEQILKISKTNPLPFMIQPEIMNNILPAEFRIPALSDSYFLKPSCGLPVLMAISLLHLGSSQGGFTSFDQIATFMHFHFPFYGYSEVLKELMLMKSNLDTKGRWMFEFHPSVACTVRLKPDTLISVYGACQNVFAYTYQFEKWMRCPSLIMLILDMRPPYWNNYYAVDIVSDSENITREVNLNSPLPAVPPLMKLTTNTGLISTTSSTSESSMSPASSLASALAHQDKESSSPVDTKEKLKSLLALSASSPAFIKQQPITEDDTITNEPHDTTNKPDLEIQVLIGMTIILYRIKEFFESEGESSWYEGYAPEWDTPINQYILAQPFTLKQLVEWLHAVFVYYKQDESIKEFLEEFKEKKNVLKYYFEIIEKSGGGTELVYRSQLSRTGDLYQQIILHFLLRDKMTDILENVEYVDIILSRKVNCSESTLFAMALLSMGNQNERCRVDIVGELLPFLTDNLGYRTMGISQLEFEPSRGESERVSVISNLVDHDLFCLKGACLAFKDDVNIPDVSSRISLYLRKLSKLNAVDFPSSVLNRFRNLKCEGAAPMLPCDYLLALALRNVAPFPGAGVTLNTTWAFLTQHFPYFKSFAAFPWRIEDLIAGSNFQGPNRFQFSQYGGDILIHLPVVHAEELYEEMAQYINQRENSIMESLSDPDSLWNIVNGLVPPTQFC